ncbi:hypothetical protein SBRCBS47491_002831 [Sporothrix bragantina]|uniref:Uncharacterized protein n=1 Tax=Sporothrix bragantina TaxID=671064 RepID=A0ABP0BA43_9PEZI
MQYELPGRGGDLSDRQVLPRDHGLALATQGVENDEVEKRYAPEEFDSVEGISVGRAIMNCWKEVFTSPDEMVESLEDQLSRRSFP